MCVCVLISVCVCINKCVCLCVAVLAGVSRPRRSLWDLKNLIDCALPSSWPVIDFADYGCYCGKGGSGTAVDKLDRCVCVCVCVCRCCETHGHCYSAAKALPA